MRVLKNFIKKGILLYIMEKNEFTNEEKSKILIDFSTNLLENQVDISPEIVKIINENYEEILL